MRVTTKQQVATLLQVILNTKEKRLFAKLDSIESTSELWTARSVVILKSISDNLRSLNKKKRISFIKLVINCDTRGLVDLLGGDSGVMRDQEWLAQMPGIPGHFDKASEQLDWVLYTACKLKFNRYPANRMQR